MTDVETALRRGLAAYAAETTAAISPPPVASIPDAAVPTRHRRPRAGVIAAAVLGVLVTTSVATAVGVLPEPVSAVLQEMRSWGFDVTEEKTQRVASASLDEMTYELWLASGDGGDECLYVRVVRVGEDIRHGGAGQCSFDTPPGPSEFLLLGLTTPIGPRVDRYGRHPTIAGRLPAGATRLEITFSNGETHRASAEPGGYFLTILPSEVPDGASVVLLRAIAADGGTVAVRSIRSRR